MRIDRVRYSEMKSYPDYSHIEISLEASVAPDEDWTEVLNALKGLVKAKLNPPEPEERSGY